MGDNPRVRESLKKVLEHPTVSEFMGSLVDLYDSMGWDIGELVIRSMFREQLAPGKKQELIQLVNDAKVSSPPFLTFAELTRPSLAASQAHHERLEGLGKSSIACKEGAWIARWLAGP